MKYRGGFVSNSSSSSFVIGIKDGELSKQKLLDILGVSESSPLFQMAEDIAEYIASASKPMNEAKMLDDYSFKSLDEAIDQGYESAKLIKAGFNVYRLYASYNESDDPSEVLIGNGGIKDIETDNFVFKGEY